MDRDYDKNIWLHALGARVGGGITYLNNFFTVMAKHLANKKTRVVLLLPTHLSQMQLPDFFEIKVLPEAARNFAARLYFDQITLPRMLKSYTNTVLFCSAYFSPVN